MSRNFRIFALAAVTFITVGLMNDARVMYILAGVCAAVILVAFLLSQLAVTRLRVEMSPPTGGAVAGNTLGERLTVDSRGSITLASAAVELAARNLTVEGVEVKHRALLPPLPPGTSVEVELGLIPPTRGRYRVGPPTIIDSDPIGMFEGRAEQGEAVELVVFPRTFDVPRVAAWETGYSRYASRGQSNRRDRGEFRGIREHTPGDDLRHVHWKVSAHVGELAVKEYEPLRHDLISIHVDLGGRNHYGEGAASTLESAISAAASIARAGLAEQRSVSLVGAGLPPEVARPGSGQAQMHRILVALAEARPAEGAFTDALGRALRVVPRGASIFVITTGAERNLAEVLAAGASAAEAVTLLIVEGALEGADERFALLPRRTMEAARAASIGIGLLRSPADIADALTAAAATHARAGLGAV
jgi:uncharacterized protein (DUF58 family)